MPPFERNIVYPEFRKQEDHWQAVVVVFNVIEQVVLQFQDKLISRHFTNIRTNEPKVDPEKQGQSKFTEESPLEHKGSSFGEKAVIKQFKGS